MNYILNSSPITYLVLGALSIYLIAIFWIFIYRLLYIRKWTSLESASLQKMLMGGSEISQNSKLFGCVNTNGNLNTQMLSACKNATLKDATNGLSFISIVASTAPFIGLFGTVVSILETFASFADSAKISFNYLAPAIGEALVATAAGILVAIFAYTFHQILKREVYKLNYAIQTQIDLLLSKKGS